MINNFFEPELWRRRINPLNAELNPIRHLLALVGARHTVHVSRIRVKNQNVLLQQDGDTAHTARAAMAVVRVMFPDRLISRFGDIPWPPRSPDLSMCVFFFLWGYLKSRVYERKPRTLEELKGAIRKQIGMINQELLERIEADCRDQLQICILQNCHHLSYIIFRT